MVMGSLTWKMELLLLSHNYNRFGFFNVFIDILKLKEINRRIKWQKE